MRGLFGFVILIIAASPVAQIVKNLPSMQEIWVQPLGWKNHLEKEMQPPPVFLPGESPAQRSLAGYSPWGHKESGATEHTADSSSGSEEQDNVFYLNKLIKVRESWLLVLFIEHFFLELTICLSKEGVEGLHSSSLFLKDIYLAVPGLS